MESEYKVQLEAFEGPLDLLLYLVKKDEVDIYDISIERITTQYLEYLETFEVLHIEVAGEFLVMAANLLYIKSRTLLPKDQQLPEEDAEEDDPRWELIRQLIEYRKFKEAAAHLRDQEDLQAALFSRAVSLDPAHAPVLDENMLIGDIGIFDLINAFQRALKRLPAEEKQGEIHEETFTVTDRINLYRMRVTAFKKEIVALGDRFRDPRLFTRSAFSHHLLKSGIYPDFPSWVFKCSFQSVGRVKLLQRNDPPRIR